MRLRIFGYGRRSTNDQSTAAVMSDAGLPTSGGGVLWGASHVSRLLAGQDARALASRQASA